MKMKNSLSYTFCGLLLTTACLLAGCSEEKIPEQPDGAKPLYIEVAPSTYADANSLNSNEANIKKIRVYVFNADGSLDNMVTSATAPVVVGVSAGTKTVAVVINESANSSGALAAANTLNGVQHATYELGDYVPKVYSGAKNTEVGSLTTPYTLPMYGQTSITVSPTAGSVPVPVSLGVKRAVARVDIYLRKKHGVTESCKFDNSGVFGGYNGGVVRVEASYPDNRGYFDPTHTMPYEHAFDIYFAKPGAQILYEAASAAPSDRTSFTRVISFYCPETDLTPMPSMAPGVRPHLSFLLHESISWDGATPVTAPGIGRWIELNDPSNPLTKLERNMIYRLYVTLAPPNEIIDMDIEVCPWEVEPVQTQPVAHDDVTNCYIVAPGGEVHIPLKQIYDAYATHPELGGPLSETAAPSVEMLWDAVSPPPNNHSTSTIEGTGMNSDKYIRVVVDDRSVGDPYVYPLEDNILIALKLDGRTVWNFHIWVTNYDPNHPASQRTSTALSGVVMMDRCLGEAPRSNTLYYPQMVQGLSYQWGRPVPFDVNPLSGGSPLVPENIQSAKVDNFADEFAYPTFILADRGLQYKDKGITKTLNPASLWYGRNGKKTIYDPCPRGWKVMPKAVFDATGAFSNFTYHTDSGHGYYSSDPFYRHTDWGDFSMAGCLISGFGWASYGERSSMWVVSSSVDASGMVENCYWGIAPSLGSQVMTPNSYATTAMVRCVKE